MAAAVDWIRRFGCWSRKPTARSSIADRGDHGALGGAARFAALTPPSFLPARGARVGRTSSQPGSCCETRDRRQDAGRIPRRARLGGGGWEGRGGRGGQLSSAGVGRETRGWASFDLSQESVDSQRRRVQVVEPCPDRELIARNRPGQLRERAQVSLVLPASE